MVRVDDELKGAYILAADTVVAVGRRILPKAELLDEAAQCLRLLSGRNHRVHTAVCLVTPNEAFRQRLVETRVRFKRLSGRGHRGLSRLRRMARQGRRLRRAGHRRQLHRQDRRLLFQRRRPAALRDHDAARRRGLSDPLRLAQCRVNAGAAAIRTGIACLSSADLTAKSVPDLRQACRQTIPAVLRQALRRRRSQPLAQRRLCGAGRRRRKTRTDERPNEAPMTRERRSRPARPEGLAAALLDSPESCLYNPRALHPPAVRRARRPGSSVGRARD